MRDYWLLRAQNMHGQNTELHMCGAFCTSLQAESAPGGHARIPPFLCSFFKHAGHGRSKMAGVEAVQVKSVAAVDSLSMWAVVLKRLTLPRPMTNPNWPTSTLSGW